MRIFQIGFNRCGTRTLSRFFRDNGLQTVHWDEGRLARRLFYNLEEGRPLIDGYADRDVFTDMEMLTSKVYLEGYKLFPILARENPDATFILNTRDRERWIQSRLAHGAGNYLQRYMHAHDLDSETGVIRHWTASWERS
ncbi:MAG TPA: sulfotransferase [Rhizomicrobium sp.]|jgi:hypothetical protein